MAFNRLIACSALSDINTTLKIGITIKWSLKLRYVVVVASLWCWKEISYNNVISVSVRSRSVGLNRNQNQTKNRCHHNIAWPLLYFKKKSVHVMITIIHAFAKREERWEIFFHLHTNCFSFNATFGIHWVKIQSERKKMQSYWRMIKMHDSDMC